MTQTPPPAAPAAKPVESNTAANKDEHWLLWLLKGLAAILKSGLIGGKELSEVIGVEGVVAFRSFGAMSIRLGDVGFGWIGLGGMSLIFVKGNGMTTFAAVVASLMIGTGTFALLSTMWDIALGKSGKSLPRYLRWVIGVLALPVNLLDSFVDALAAPVITGAFILLATVPFSEWETVINQNPVLFGITGILAILFFIFSFFGELITKIIEMEGQQVIAETTQKPEEKKEEKTPDTAPAEEDPRFPEEFHINYDANAHKAVTHPQAPNRRIIFAKDAKQGAKPLGWCYANEVAPAKEKKETTPPPPITTH